MKRFIEVLLIVVFFASVSEAWLFKKKKNWPVKAVGRVTCDGQSMPYVYIQLMDKDFLFDQRMGSTRANGLGQFIVSGSGRDGRRGKPDPYIRVSYSYSGPYGRMKVVKLFKIARRGKSGVKPYSSYINFGTLNFASIHCRAYVKFYLAIRDFKLRANRPLPYSVLNIRTKAIVHGGTPYATTNTIRIPGKYHTISYGTAKHELAHTIRHSYDGSFGHFLIDVARFKYTQHHTCGKRTNNGFAFNEGWAEFWEGSCYGIYGNPKDYAIEGNVAKALRALKSKCNSSYSKMVQVLSHRGRRERVHSFNAYNWKHYRLFKCKL